MAEEEKSGLLSRLFGGGDDDTTVIVDSSQQEEGTTQADYIVEQAELLGVPAILARKDLPDQRPVTSAHGQLYKWAVEQPDFLCLLADKATLVTSKPSHPSVQTAKNLLASMGNQPVVRPATQNVVRYLRERLTDETAAAADVAAQEMAQISNTTTDVQRLFHAIVEAALSRGASDIHMEMREKLTNIKFRIDGRLLLFDTVGREELVALGNYMFNAEAKRGSLQFMLDKPLHGSLDFRMGSLVVPIRLSTAPDVRGIDIFLRIWRPDTGGIKIENTGYSPLQISLMKEAMARPYGVIVMSGPTGSGKSTSLTALLETVDPQYKIVSLEEPVERMLPNVTHVPIAMHVAESGWDTLRASLNRWDTNINMLGEVKDRSTAEAIKDLATSGKLCVTTLHSSNVLSIPSRLEDLGVEASMIYDPNFLVCLINQRLLPQSCENCRVPMSKYVDRLDIYTRNRYKKIFEGHENEVYFLGTGCSQCEGSGISGRRLAAEVVMVDDDGRAFIRQRDQMGWRGYLMERGWDPIVHHVMSHILCGAVDPLVAERAIGLLDSSTQVQFDYKLRQEALDAAIAREKEEEQASSGQSADGSTDSQQQAAS